MKSRILSTVMLCCIVCLTGCTVYTESRTFTVASGDRVSERKKFVQGFTNDRVPTNKHPDESQIVVWRTPSSTAEKLTIHGIKGVTHFGGNQLHELEKAGPGVFTISPQGRPTRLPVDKAEQA